MSEISAAIPLLTLRGMGECGSGKRVCIPQIDRNLVFPPAAAGLGPARPTDPAPAGGKQLVKRQCTQSRSLQASIRHLQSSAVALRNQGPQPYRATSSPWRGHRQRPSRARGSTPGPTSGPKASHKLACRSLSTAAPLEPSCNCLTKPPGLCRRKLREAEETAWSRKLPVLRRLVRIG